MAAIYSDGRFVAGAAQIRVNADRSPGRPAPGQVGMVSRPATVRPFFGAEATWAHARGDAHAGKVGLMRDTGQARGLDLQPGTKLTT